MKTLVYGAGVLGSLYAAQLKEAGHDVAILARGERLEEIRANGLMLVDASKGRRTVTRVDVVEALNPDDTYDLILVIIPKHQVASVLPIISASKSSSSILFMLNNPSGFNEWTQAIGRERLLVGFPGAGGRREGGVIHYRILPGFMQPTTIGEPDGAVNDRTKVLAPLFRKAGFPTSISTNMDAWLKYHVAWVSPLMNAMYMAGGDARALADKPEMVGLMVKAVREGFTVLRTLGLPTTPSSLRIRWELFPISSTVFSFRRILKTRLFEDVAGGHARDALPEFKLLSDEFQVLARSTDRQTPAIDELHNYIATFEVEHTSA